MLAAVGERTRGDMGPGVTCPSFRFHPAIVAQAAATLEAMNPGRSWLGLGTGEALNEHVVPGYWPEAGERSRRMREAVELINQLFTASLKGRDTKFSGEFFRMETTRLWTMPEHAPPVLVATAGPLNAKKTGRFADGIITVGAPLDKIGGLFAKFEEGAREAGKDPSRMPRIPQLHLSWAQTDEEALENAVTEWPNGGMKFPKADIRSPLEFEQMAKPAAGGPGHLLRPGRAPRRDPALRRPRLRPGLPAQRRAQPARVDRGLRPRRPAQAHPLRRPTLCP